MGRSTADSLKFCVICFALGGLGCTKLGPTPAMTGVSSVPIGRPGLELQAAAVPGYFLSSGAREDPHGEAMSQLSAVLEPDELIHVPGLFAGGRYAGSSESGAAVEPLLGYRRFLDEEQRFGLGAVGYLAYQSAELSAADFTALRGGLELGVDARLTAPSEYVELHANVGASFTAIDADGRYCAELDSGLGVDCASAPRPTAPRVDAALSGVFPSAHAGASVDFGRHLGGPFHGVKLAFDLAGGTLPTLLGGEQKSAKLYGASGLSLTLGLGAAEPSALSAPR
jgi:hypothetical protein